MQLHYGDLIPNFVLNLPEPNLDAENDQSKLSFTGSLNQWVWPCSLILTEYLLRSDIMTSLSSRAKSSMKTTKTIQSGNKVEVQEKTRIVELGAGLGLPLMAVDSWLTHAGSRNQVELMATEYSEIGCEWLREIFGSKLDAVYEWDWNQISTIRPEWADAMLFLASDILYDPSGLWNYFSNQVLFLNGQLEWPNIFMSLAVLLKRSPGSRCIMTYQCRR